ncbi:thiolase-like protein [Aspergillus granulosus]|uniref:Thiolase-like protein n=1 Tax=Aspergillus granulosus TaxID=176169 RepID=A0ABR4GYY6_9EURO
MGPQQRLLLEAGLTLEDVSGSKTAIYCGSFSSDYSSMLHKDLAQYPKYTVTGVGNSILANRISYFFNLHGPSLTIDTACSSSLRESDIAIVAGSALHLDPNIFITMTDFGMLSVDGRCWTFDAAGSGYVRGEGICAVVLKRKRGAVISGDHIRAAVRATHTNHDGLKDGLTLPNEEAQAELIRQTYNKAGLSTTDTDYFEAHGTGTAAGDPRETKAIGEVFGPERERPLLVGSVKSNVGHLGGASGLIGVIKAAMSVELGQIPPNMHFNTPNRKIDFAGLKIQVPTEVHQWRGGNGLRRASINSFGYGGSNAHAILENYIADPTDFILELNAPDIAHAQDRPFLLPLTSHRRRRGNFSPKRLHTIGKLSLPYISIVSALLEPQPQAAWKEKIGNHPRVGFVFTGQGAQWYAMGRELIQQSSLFHQVLERCDDILHELPDAPTWFIVDELLKSKGASPLSQSLYSQPLCAALQLAIIVAAYTAGALPFESAIICAYYRGLYMSKGSGTSCGAMLAVGMTEREAATELIEYTGRIAVAAEEAGMRREKSTIYTQDDEEGALYGEGEEA